MPLSDFFPELKGWVTAQDVVKATPEIPAVQLQASPFLRAALPLPLQYSPDTLKQYYRPGLSAFRIAPQSPSSFPAINAASSGVSTKTVSTATIAAIPPSTSAAITLTKNVLPAFDNSVGASGSGTTASVTGSPTNAPSVAIVTSVNQQGSRGNNPLATKWADGDGGAIIFWTKLYNTSSLTANQPIASGPKWAQALAFFNISSVSELPYQATWVKMVSGSRANGNFTTTTFNATPGHSLLAVMHLNQNSAGFFTIQESYTASDTGGNVWTQIANPVSSLAGGTGAQVVMLFAPNISSGSIAVTFTQTAGDTAGNVAMNYSIWDLPYVLGYSTITISNGSSSFNALGQ